MGLPILKNLRGSLVPSFDQTTPFTPRGPIPGENYTSNTKNYPWHRPPEMTDLDTAIEAIMKQLATKQTAYSLLTVLQAGVDIVTAVDIFLTNSIGSGKITPDMALLLAGPTAHIMMIMAKDYGIDFDMGLDDQAPPTISFLKAKADINPRKVVNVLEDVTKETDAVKAQAAKQMGRSTGFMSGMPNMGGEEPQMQENSPMHESNPLDGQEDSGEGDMS